MNEYIITTNTRLPFGIFVSNNLDFIYLIVKIAIESVRIPSKKDVIGSGTPKNLHEAMITPSTMQIGHATIYPLGSSILLTLTTTSLVSLYSKIKSQGGFTFKARFKFFEKFILSVPYTETKSIITLVICNHL